MNEIGNFYHSQAKLDPSTIEQRQQDKEAHHTTRTDASEKRAIKDTVSISPEAQRRLESASLDKARPEQPPTSREEELFNKFDVNGNGTVTLREFQSVLKDNGVSRKEFNNLVEWFKSVELDADNQEGITKVEAERLFNIAKGGPAAGFYFYDANSDGVVGKRELIDMVERNGGSIERLMSLFEKMDKNGDDQLTLAEFREAISNINSDTNDKRIAHARLNQENS